MRILANYGYKTNGESYSVTFETTGDVPLDKAPQTVDELFKLAKEAIQRQINPQQNNEILQPKQNSNGKTLAIQKQISLIKKLAKRKNRKINLPQNLTKRQASELIDYLQSL